MQEIEGYIRYITNIKRYSKRTQDIYRSVLEEYFSYADNLTVRDIRNYEVHLLDEKKESARTVGLHLSVLSGYCKYLMKQGLMESNPARLVKRPKMEKRLPTVYREEALDGYLESTGHSASEEELDIQVADPDSKVSLELYERRLGRLIVDILYCTGMRRSELISLNRSSVDFARKQIKVLGKGDKMREIPLIDSLSQEISLYLQSVDSIRGSASGPDAPLLQTPKGGRLYPVFVDRAIKKELGAADGITGRKSPHVLRHTLATELLDGGADLYSIKELLGHSSLAATQVYTHNSIERLKSVYDNAHPRAKNGGNNGDQSQNVEIRRR